jgi:acyl transferase domain-containing protein
VSVWAEVFLGIIAVSTLATSLIQVGVLIAAGRMARRLSGLIDRAERELRPTFEHVNAIARDASRAVALATVQVERADHLFNDVTKKIEDTMTIVQSSIMAPAREGKALLHAFRAAMEVVREARRRSRSRQRGEDEDALFI